MKKDQFFRRCGLIILCSMIVVLACSSGSYIYLNYRLPAKSEGLENKTVSIVFKDERTDQTLFSDKAAKEYKFFTGVFSLSLLQGKKKSVFLGTHELPSLFETAFAQRLSDLGVTVASQKPSTDPVFEIVLKEFLIDLKGRNWIAAIVYEIHLIRGSKILATQNIDGRAERLKVMGKRDAEKVLEDIFTDTVNKLDIDKLFTDARL